MNSGIWKIVMSLALLLAVYVTMCVYLPGQAAKDKVSAGTDSTNDLISTEKDYININYTGKTVVLDSGHGGVDPGKESADGVLEKDINLAIALKVEKQLKDIGVNVIMTRKSDEGLYSETDSNKKRADMKKRCKIINESAADVVVSIHQNSYTDASVKGAQMFYYANSADGKRLAEILQASFVQNVDSQNKRVPKADKTYYMLVNTKVPTVIAECGFLSNPDEAQLLATESYQKKIAGAVCEGVLEYLSQ